MQQKQVALPAIHSCVCGKQPKAYKSFGTLAPDKFHLECAACSYRTVALSSLAKVVAEWTRIIYVVRKDQLGEAHNEQRISVINTLDATRAKGSR